VNCLIHSYPETDDAYQLRVDDTEGISWFWCVGSNNWPDYWYKSSERGRENDYVWNKNRERWHCYWLDSLDHVSQKQLLIN